MQILAIDRDTHPNPENVLMENEPVLYLLLLPWMPDNKNLQDMSECILKPCQIAQKRVN